MTASNNHPNRSLTTRAVAKKFAPMSIEQIEAWLYDESGKGARIVNSMRERAEAGDANARALFGCIIDNDAGALRINAKNILA